MSPAPVAALPMYDWPEVQWANDVLWSATADALRRQGIAAPLRLARDRPLADVWLDEGLVLSQTCGYPFARDLHGRVRLVATPVYDVEGCDGGSYSSMIVTRASERAGGLADFQGRRFALNSRGSLSGFLALKAAMAADGMGLDDAAGWIETGGHRNSLRAVAAGQADIAAIDAVCWALAARHEPELMRQLKAIGRTALRPGLPLITAGHRGDAELAAIRAALQAALDAPETAAARRALHLAGLAVFDVADYRPLADLA